MALQIGLRGEVRTTSGAANSAAAMKSGSLAVFATPAMCALMEEAACAAVAAHLPAGSTTVGTALAITHERATALGQEVRACAELLQIDGRKLVFSVTASDAKGIIGRGRHERFLVDSAKFMSKLA